MASVFKEKIKALAQPPTHHQCWGQGQEPLLVPGESSLHPATLMPTLQTPVGHVNGIKRSRLNGTMD